MDVLRQRCCVEVGLCLEFLRFLTGGITLGTAGTQMVYKDLSLEPGAKVVNIGEPRTEPQGTLDIKQSGNKGRSRKGDG